MNTDSQYVNVDIIPEFEVADENVKKIGIVAKIKIKEGWHLYWKNPGDVGEPTVLNYEKKIQYDDLLQISSKPKKKKFEDIITSYVYEDYVYFYNEFMINNYQKNEVLEFDLSFSYNACKEECIPEKLNINFKIPMKNKRVFNDKFVKEYDNALKEFLIDKKAEYEIVGNDLYIKFDGDEIKNCKDIEFVSVRGKKNIISELPKTSVIDGSKIKVVFADGELDEETKGILLCDDIGYNLVKVDNDIVTNVEKAWYYFILAFLAGIILNLMPCVLPVLGLKALAIVMNNRKSNIKGAISYMFGILLSFLGLAGIIFYAKNKGEELGWGFQLQSVEFNIFLLLLFFVIFLILMDKIYISDRWSDKLNKIAGDKNFLLGFFAVMIACPCTGPFMGGAIGFAISQNNYIYWGIFLMLGLGYAIPYVLIEIFPNLFLKYMPKPGIWMIKLKRVLAFLIALTCLWLGWVIFNQLFSYEEKNDMTWQKYSLEKIEKDIKNKKPIFINFTAKWCLVCLLNEKTTLGTKKFDSLMEENNVSVYKADWTNKDNDILKELGKFGRNSVPLYVYYDKNGKYKILSQILSIDEISSLFGSKN